jgi:predicted nucleic acid-binding protein
MIVVDTSVWIAHFRNQATPAVAALRALPNPNDIIVGDLVLLECLQGARDEAHASRIETSMRAFQIEAMLDADIAINAARNFRTLRALGQTPRKTIDTIIATFCIRKGYRLLHQDRDFEPMVVHLGLLAAL